MECEWVAFDLGRGASYRGERTEKGEGKHTNVRARWQRGWRERLAGVDRERKSKATLGTVILEPGSPMRIQSKYTCVSISDESR